MVSRPFIVEPPERHRLERQTAQRRSQTVSPQRGSSVSDRRRQEGPRYPAPSSRGPRDSQQNREFRRPRERSPVAERVPIRRSHSSPPPRAVEIHNHRTEDNNPSRSSRERNGQKRVHFASDVERKPTHDRDPPDHRGRQEVPGPHRSSFFSDNRDRRYEIVEIRPSRRQQPQRRHTRESSPWPGKQREMQRDRVTPNIIHARPKIIQDGNRYMSRAGERICTEARRRPNYETYRDRIVIDDRDRRRWR